MGMIGFIVPESERWTGEGELHVFSDKSIVRVFREEGIRITIGAESPIDRLRDVGINRPDSYIMTTEAFSICIGHGFACKLIGGYMMEPFDPTPFEAITVTIGEQLEIAGIDLPGKVLSLTCRSGEGDEAYALTRSISENGPNPLDMYRDYCRNRLAQSQVELYSAL